MIRLAEGTNHVCSYILYLTLKIITNYKISLSAGRQLCRQTLIYLIPKIKKKCQIIFFNMKSVTLLSPQSVTHFSAFPRNIDLALV